MNPKKALWLAAAGVGAATYAYWLRPKHLRWGASDAEIAETLPGDEFTPEARQSATHAITIDAPVEAVWSWVVQIGQDKGGFYSYTWLENLVGCHMKNADRILPEYQELHEGDSVLLHPRVPPLPVLAVEPCRHLVLGSNTSDQGTWAFYLRAISGNKTRLIIRGRGEWNPSVLKWITRYVIFEPAHFIMERKMMLSIKAHAEQHSNGSESGMTR